MKHHTLLAISCLLAGVRAQACFHTHGAEPARQGSESTYSTFLSLPDSALGAGRRAQLMISRLSFQSAPVLITGFAVAPESTEQVHFGSLEIWMGYTNRDALAASFASNPNGPMTKVVDLRQHLWTCRIWEWTDIGLQQPFLYVPAAGNLLIEVIARRADAGTAAPALVCNALGGERLVDAIFNGTLPGAGGVTRWAPKIQVCAERARLDQFGIGCAGSGTSRPALGLTGSAQLGQTVTAWLSNAPAATSSIFILGASNRAPALPVDLDAIGMPGCKLYVSTDVGLPLGTDLLGIGRQLLVIPNQSTLVASNVYGQFFVLDPTGNSRGLTASNYGRILIGY